MGSLDAITDSISQAAWLNHIAGSKYSRQDALVSIGNEPAATELLDAVILREIVEDWCLTDRYDYLISRDKSAIVGIYALLGNLLGEEWPYQLTATALYILNFICKGCWFLYIHSHYGLSTHIKGSTAGIHTGVTTADNNYTLANLWIQAGIYLLQEVQTHGQKLLALPVKEAGLMTTGSNNNCIVDTADLSKLVLIYTTRSNKLYANILDTLQLAYQHIMHETASWNNLLQLAADMLSIIIYGYAVALATQLPGSRQACHTAADNADFLASFLSRRCYLLVGRNPAQVADLDRLVNAAAGTAIHTRIWANAAADRTREWSIFQLQINSFLYLALTEEIHSSLGRDAGRAAELTWSIVFCIVPAWYTETVQAMGNGVVYSEIIHGNITEDTALYPLLGTELLQGTTLLWLSLLFLKGQRTKLLPLAPVGQLCLQLRLLDFLQELIHTASQEVNIRLIQIQIADIRWIGADWATDINNATNHTYTGTLTQHRLKLVTVIAADNSTAATHKLKGE